jgi:broad specificity phosphatase PhoE
MQIIYVVRHGETDINLNNKVNDKNISVTINKTGIKQAKQTGKYFKNRKLSKSNCIIYSSPSKRAIDTAKLISNELKMSDVKQDNRIIEFDQGLLSGLDKDSLVLQQFLSEFDKFTKKYKNDRISIELNFDEFDKHKAKKYKAELRSVIKKRVESFLDSLPSKPKHIIIVTHNGIMGVIQELLTGPVPDKTCGDITNGKNCTIMGIVKTNITKKICNTNNFKENQVTHFKVISFPNSEHLK